MKPSHTGITSFKSQKKKRAQGKQVRWYYSQFNGEEIAIPKKWMESGLPGEDLCQQSHASLSICPHSTWRSLNVYWIDP